jgi:nucleoside-diphosphate-sugar epimerase
MTRHKVAIVGGAGYIGSALADHLSSAFDVKVVDKNILPKKLASNNLEYECCSIVEYDQTRHALEGSDVVIHTAIVQIPTINEQKELGYSTNIVGTQNVCRVVNETASIKGMILIGSWHVFGEKGIEGTVDEEFGFRPDAVAARARLYALSKIGQEVAVRMYGEMSEKTYAVIRVGTVLGEEMPEQTAAKIFINRALKGQSITPYRVDMYRPMLYVDVNDVCRMCEVYVSRILNGDTGDLPRIVNLLWPDPITIIELAREIRESITTLSNGRIRPKIEIVDSNVRSFYTSKSKGKMKVNIHKAQRLLNSKLTSPSQSVERIVRNAIR